MAWVTTTAKPSSIDGKRNKSPQHIRWEGFLEEPWPEIRPWSQAVCKCRTIAAYFSDKAKLKAMVRNLFDQFGNVIGPFSQTKGSHTQTLKG